MRKNVAIILAGGEGKRFRNNTPKQFLKLSGKTVIEHTIDVFEKHELIDGIYVVINPLYYNFMVKILRENTYTKVEKLLKGGRTRQESSKIGVFACSEDVDKVLIHDVRPFISHKVISEVVKKLDIYPAVDVAIPPTDTIIKVSTEKKIITDIPDRNFLMRGQTPQGFKLKIIKKAHELADKEGLIKSFDDCSLVLRYNMGNIYIINGAPSNIKLTHPEDIYLAERLFQVRNINIDNLDVKKKLRELKNKVAVIFGGSRGIGRQICEIGGKYGAMIHSFSRENNVDITDYNAVKSALKEIHKLHGKIDIVICTAGLLKMARIETTSIDEIEKQIKINLLGSIIVAKESISYLKKTKGSITLFTARSYTRGREGCAAYSSSKAGIVNFAQTLSDELYHYGIRVNAICPERTDTLMRRSNFGKEPKETLLSPKTVAYISLAVTLSNITGQVIDVRKSDEKELLKLIGEQL